MVFVFKSWSIRVCLDFYFASENELKFAQVRHEKRSLAALNEHFRNETWANFSHLQREVEIQTHSSSHKIKRFLQTFHWEKINFKPHALLPDLFAV
jgi:hypothetical protein